LGAAFFLLQKCDILSFLCLKNITELGFDLIRKYNHLIKHKLFPTSKSIKILFLTDFKSKIMFKEFKDFIMTGNVVDFAVAVILAAAVGLVVNGFVNDIVMPVIGQAAGGMDFASMRHVLAEAVVAADGTVTTPENAIRYGAWINTIINLIIVGFVLFMIVRAYNKTKTPPAAAAPAGPTTEELLAEIRDALKK
jgi:large conductance mechanosensitive channel